MKQLEPLLTALLAVAAIVVAAVLVRREFYPERARADGFRASAVVSKIDPALWDDLRAASRDVTTAGQAPSVVVLSDYECPACRGFERLARDMLRKDPGLFALSIVHTPLSYHRFAAPAARFAECAAERGLFAEAHHLLFEVQDSLGLIPWESLAQRAGARDVGPIAACALADATERRFDRIEQGAELARRVGLEGTPTVIVDGLKFDRTPTEAQLRGVLDSARANRPREP